MADDVTYTSTNPAGVPNATKQATDEHATRGHMPIVKLAYSADGDATHVPADADGLLVNLGTNNDVTVTGTVTTTGAKPSTSALANVATSTTSATLLAANANRLGAMIHNDSTRNLYVKFGTTASNTSFTVLMPANSYYEVPFGYTGRIDGILASQSGTARVTELTA